MPGSSADDSAEGIEFAWKVHESLSTWTGRVDTKASIMLTLELATLSFAVALTDGTKLFASLSGWRQSFFVAGLALLGIGICAAMAVVFPQLARRRNRRDWRSGLIYFGHLRYWNRDALQTALMSLTPVEVLAALSSQLIMMATIAWRKHVLLQASVGCGFSGVVALTVAGGG